MHRFLIVNADDFGQSDGVNRGIIAAHERGILTSASLMVRWPGASAAAEYGRTHPRLGVGLHLDFGEWDCRQGEWRWVYRVVDESDAPAVDREVAAQLEAFRRLMGRDPTHLDSHQHVHRDEPARSIVARAGRELNIPVRDLDPSIRYLGGFYGQNGDGTPWPEGITAAALIGILHSLEPGITELGCHPAAADDLDTMYGAERLQELAALCDPGVRDALRGLGIRLGSFADFTPART